MTTHKSQATADRTSLRALLGTDEELMRTLVREAVQQVLEAEMSDQLQAAPGERTEGRLGYRAGYYPRTLITRVGKLELR
ncbi:transposase, partial [Thioalkalivibrio sp. ALgr5]